MNGKEEKFFGALAEAGTLLGKMGDTLLTAADGKLSPEDMTGAVRSVHDDWRRAVPSLHEKLFRAFGEKAESEAARMLLAETESLLRSAEKLSEILTAAGLAKEEESRMILTLAAYAFRELSRIMGYSVTIRNDYMKAEARTQKLISYETRGREMLAGSIARLSEESGGMAAVKLRIYEIAEDILSGAAESSLYFQKLTEAFL